MSWQIVYTKQAKKDAKKLSHHNSKVQASVLLDLPANNPYQIPPSYEKLVDNLNGAYSRRINVQHRLVYQVIKTENVVKVLRMWSHYE